MKKFFVGVGIVMSSLLAAQNYHTTVLGNLDFAADGNSVWGAVVGGKEYAFYGLTSSDAYVVIDVSDPTNPTEIFRGSGTRSLWRNMKFYDNHMYAVTEGFGDGISIVDLNPLKSSGQLAQSKFTDDGQLRSTHTSFMDEDNGHLYLWGAKHSQGEGVYVYDVKSNPDKPSLIAHYSTPYVHDGYVKDGMMYCAHINDGYMAVYDISDGTNAVLQGNVFTPNNYCHNVWPNADRTVAFTTDEKPNSYLAAYDISNPSDIKELDRIQAAAGSNAIIHNVRLINDDYAAVAYYVEGLMIYNIADPENIIEVAQFDTSPFSGNGFHGAWEVYPWLPSGNFLVSDIEEGLFVISPEYHEPSRVGGTVIDGITKQPLIGVEIYVPEANMVKESKIGGKFKTGYGKEGQYTVEFAKAGYVTKEITYSNETLGESIEGVVVELFPIGSAVNETFGSLGIEMYPNPTTNAVTLNVPLEVSAVSYSVTDITGKVLSTNNLEIGQQQIDVAALTPGLYMMQVLLAEGQTISSKFVKK